MLTQALKYLEKGWSVIPLGSITLDEKGNKKIIYPVPWKEFESRLPNEDELKSWFEVKKYPNIGIVTGKISKLFVFDVDTYKPPFDRERFNTFRIPITPSQRTARGGTQYFFS